MGREGDWSKNFIVCLNHTGSEESLFQSLVLLTQPYCKPLYKSRHRNIKWWPCWEIEVSTAWPVKMQTQTQIFAPEQPHDMNNYYFDWKHIETSLTHKNKLFKYSTPEILNTSPFILENMWLFCVRYDQWLKTTLKNNNSQTCRSTKANLFFMLDAPSCSDLKFYLTTLNTS